MVHEYLKEAQAKEQVIQSERHNIRPEEEQLLKAAKKDSEEITMSKTE